MKIKAVLLTILTTSILFGCSSTDQVSIMADHRAAVLESSLPYKSGPLHIMSAQAKDHTVELLMIYNDTGKIAPSALIDASIRYYCSDKEVRTVLDQGVVYKLILRSERGKLISEEVASKEACEALEKEE